MKRIVPGDALRRFGRALLPPRCLLCGGAGQDDLDLCRECAAALPRNEKCCTRCGEPLEIAGTVCGRCQRSPPPWQSVWVPFRYAWPLDHLETRFKFGASLACGRALAQLWITAARPAELPAAIVPVPLHRARLRERGYNQALELARPLARALGVHIAAHALRRDRATAAQTALDAKARRHNLRGAFSLAPDVALPRHIAIVDDVMTTGSTLAECTRVLLAGGVERVDAWALARAPARH